MDATMAQFLITPLGIEEKNVRTIRDACRGNNPWVIFPIQHRPVGVLAANLLTRDEARRIAIKMAKLAGAVNVVDPQPITGSALAITAAMSDPVFPWAAKPRIVLMALGANTRRAPCRSPPLGARWPLSSCLQSILPVVMAPYSCPASVAPGYATSP